MAYRFKNYKSVYRDPGSVFVNTTLRKRYDDNFTDHNLVQENLQKMLVTAEFDGDMQRAQKLRDQLNSNSETRLKSGDFENMQGAIAADVAAFNKAYTPIQRNYEAREENKKEAQKMVMSGNRSGEWYEKWLNRSLMTTGENGDYTPYTGLSDMEDGSVNPASYYQRQAVSVDKKPAEEVLNSVKAILSERYGGQVTQLKQARYVEGFGMVDYIVTKKDGTTEYIKADTIKNFVHDVMANREDLQSFMRDKADLNTFDLSSHELDQNLALRSAKLQDDLDNGQMSNKNKITSEERAKMEARIREIDDAIESDDMALKREATRGADYENQYDAIMDMAIQARAHSSTVGGGKTSTIDPLWLTKYKADQAALLHTQFNLSTPGGSGQTVRGNDIFADEEGNVSAQSLAAAADSGEAMRNGNTANLFPYGDGTSSYPVLTDLIANIGRVHNSGAGGNLTVAYQPGSGQGTQAEVNAALAGISDDAINRLVADASGYQGAFTNNSNNETLNPKDAVGLLQEMRNSLAFSNNISLNSQRFLNIATSNSDLSPNTFPSKVQEFLPAIPEGGFGSSEEITSYMQPALNTMVLGMYNGMNETNGMLEPSEMDNPNEDHPAVGNMMEFLSPLLNTYEIPGEMRAELINNSLEAVRNMYETQSTDESVFNDYGGLIPSVHIPDQKVDTPLMTMEGPVYHTIQGSTTGGGIDLVNGVNDIIETGSQQVQDFIDNANVANIYLPESTNAPMDMSKNFALSTSFKKQLGLRSMTILQGMPTAASAHTAHPVDVLTATTIEEGAPFSGRAGNVRVESLSGVNLSNYEIVGPETMFSEESTNNAKLITTVIIKAKKIDNDLPGPSTFRVEVPYDKLVMNDDLTTGGNFGQLMNANSIGMQLRNEILAMGMNMSTISTSSEGFTFAFKRGENQNGRGVDLQIQVKAALGKANADGLQALELNDNTPITVSGTGVTGNYINKRQMTLGDIVRFINGAGL